jgi:hypothetical protein
MAPNRDEFQITNAAEPIQFEKRINKIIAGITSISKKSTAEAQRTQRKKQNFNHRGTKKSIRPFF